MIRSKKITQSAKGESCTLQIAGFCHGDTDSVVFCHFPDESHGMGIKSDDICGGGAHAFSSSGFWRALPMTSSSPSSASCGQYAQAGQ